MKKALRVAISAVPSLVALMVCACGGGGGGGTSTASPATASPVGSYTIGGSISGLTVSGLVLSLGNQTVSPTPGTTTFTFPQSVANGSAYAVVVQTQPPGLHCTVNGGSGTMGASPYAGIAVACASAERVLHSFGSPNVTSDGTFPYCAPIAASDGFFYGTTGNGGAFPGAGSGGGTIYRFDSAGVETIVHSFGASGDGQYPTAGLTLASDGNFYGVTQLGGTNSVGTVFVYTPGGSERVLYSFSLQPADAWLPDTSLVQGADAALYGTAQGGGANGRGAVFRVTTAGVESLLYSFGASGTSDGAKPIGLILANDGNFYGTTVVGGTNNNGTIFRLTPAGVESVIYTFGATGTGDGIQPSGPPVLGNDGALYGMTSYGGANGTGMVYKITLGGTYTAIRSFGPQGAGDGQKPIGSLIVGHDGQLYGMTAAGGASGYGGTIFRMTTAGIETVLYSFPAQPGDGLMPSSGLFQASDGNLYGTTLTGGANSGTGTVIVYTP